MKKKLIALALTGIVASCSIRNLTNDYDLLNESQRNKIVALNNFNDAKPDLIHKINGKQLHDELKNHNKSIVYVFKNGCTSTYCKPMSNYVNYAKEHQYTLFLVMDGYINLDETTDQYPASTLYAIDNDFYHEHKKATYRRFFLNDLCNLPTKAKSEKYMGNLYFFTSDKLDTVMRELPKN